MAAIDDPHVQEVLRRQKRLVIFVLGAIAVVLAGLAVGGVLAYRADDDFVRHAVRTTGSVISVKPDPRQQSASLITYRWTLTDGRTQEKTSSELSGGEVGFPIEIYYDTRHPSHAYPGPSTDGPEYVVEFWLVAVGLLIVIAVAGMFVAHRVRTLYYVHRSLQQNEWTTASVERWRLRAAEHIFVMRQSPESEPIVLSRSFIAREPWDGHQHWPETVNVVGIDDKYTILRPLDERWFAVCEKANRLNRWRVQRWLRTHYRKSADGEVVGGGADCPVAEP